MERCHSIIDVRKRVRQAISLIPVHGGADMRTILRSVVTMQPGHGADDILAVRDALDGFTASPWAVEAQQLLTAALNYWSDDALCPYCGEDLHDCECHDTVAGFPLGGCKD